MPQFDAASMTDLDGRTQYESWLLEAVYEVVDDALTFRNHDGIVFPPEGGPPPTHIGFLSSHARLGDWRAGFLEAGAPLVLVTTFKLIDMLVEWVLEQNGQTVPWRFAQKLLAIKGAVLFPSQVESRGWLRERLIALYEHGEPLRSTVIHHRTFTSTGGGLLISSSKGASAGTPVSISAAELRRLAVTVLSVLHCIRGSWSLDVLREKQLRFALDGLAVLHRLPSLGQTEPVLKNIRVYRWDADEVEIDIEPLRIEAHRTANGQDVVFRVRIVVISRDDSTAAAFQIPFEELTAKVFTLRRTARAVFAVPVPSDIIPERIAAVLPA